MTQSLHVISRLRIALGTFVAIDAEASDQRCAERGIAAAFAAVSAVERLMHPTRCDSDLAALAGSPVGTPVMVHAWTFEVLELCKRLHQLSHGVFDPCLDTASGRMPDLELTARCVVPHAPLCVDLGGIAKGFAVDRAIEALRAAGCEGGLVNAGGDLAVFGTGSREFICRDGDGAVAVVELSNAALATSDAQRASRPAEHRGYYHGIDRTAAVSGTVTVRAAQAAVADGLTKCLLQGDRALHMKLLDDFGARQVR